MDLSRILIPIMVTLAAGGVFYALAYPFLSGQAKADKRVAAMRTRSPQQIAERTNDVAKRRKQVADSLKEIDARAKSKKATFETKLIQAGLRWTKKKFLIISAVIGLVFAVVAFIVTGNPLMTIGVGIVGGVGFPAWLVKYLRNRRIKSFLKEFPAAVDIIVRGIKAGIPLGDCLRNIAAEAAEPVRSEFRSIVEAQMMGLSIPEAVERIVERIPAPEASFFAIVINIQAKAGGNLAEALANLSNVLRDRKKMKGKIKAMSSEAKASAGIIGALPPLVTLFVYLTSPDYISLLFTTSVGHITLGICAVWMAMGIFIMKKMINFDM